MNQPVTIPQNPILLPSEDYTFLRQKGIEWIEKLGSNLWTDYNLHDPGITTLELLCFALTDLGYRTGFDMKDLLADALQQGGAEQAFFTAANILTTNPLTVNDFRKLLIDLNGVQNAWLFCKDCPCEVPVFANCNDNTLTYLPTNKEIIPKGLYDIYLELEDDPKLGNLNNGKLKHTLAVITPAGQLTAIFELRLPAFDAIKANKDLFGNLFNPGLQISSVQLTKISNANGVALTDATLLKALKKPLFLQLEIGFQGVAQPLVLQNVALTLFFANPDHQNRLTLAIIKDELENKDGILKTYRDKLFKINSLLHHAQAVLHAHRNLDEDYCQLHIVPIQDIAICADVELTPNADIEQVLAHIYFETEQYLNPPVRCYPLAQMLEDGVPVDEIFNGPPLLHGFIKTDELENAGLKHEIRTSDIINRLMDIEGVVSVSNFLLTAYDASGTAMLPSQPWILQVTAQHQPRLYIEQSKVLFFKTGLPFLPANPHEVTATLQQLHSNTEQLKLTIHQNDLPLPQGQNRNIEDYFPVQYSFPLNYGIGPEGLPQTVSPLRRAQAKQLQAYLLFFEQLLANYLAQLNRVSGLFALNPALTRSYYTHFLDATQINGVADLYEPAFTPAILDQLAETPETGLERRNRFLDHLMARFGEQFTDYALLLYSMENGKKAPVELLKDKVNFMKDYPFASRNRAKAFNYLDEVKVCGFQNVAGLKKRIGLLLGMEQLRNYFDIGIQKNPFSEQYKVSFGLTVGNEQLFSPQIYLAQSRPEADNLAYNATNLVIAFIADATHYTPATKNSGNKWQFTLTGKDGVTPVAVSGLFDDETLANNAATSMCNQAKEIMEFERFFIAEHLLLRPKLPGQALLPVCLDPDCDTCGEEDPYSFRLTFVMPGWLPVFQNLSFRRFAEQTIRLETPAHLLGKICWVGNDVCPEDASGIILCQITDLLQAQVSGTPNDNTNKQLCNCALTILQTYNLAFRNYHAQNGFKPLSQTEREQLFDQYLPLNSIVCNNNLQAAFYPLLRSLLVNYFAGKELCFQFNRFEHAWCNWLTENAKLNPQELPIAAQFEYRLAYELQQAGIAHTSKQVCQCITALLSTYGEQLRLWVAANINTVVTNTQWQTQLEQLINNLSFTCPLALSNTVKQTLLSQLANFYAGKLPLLQTHAALLDVLAQLKSIYPPATLHDCEEGDDTNPVRLNETVLG